MLVMQKGWPAGVEQDPLVGVPAAGDVIRLVVTRPGRHRDAYRREGAVASGPELEMRARGNGYAGRLRITIRLTILPSRTVK